MYIFIIPVSSSVGDGDVGGGAEKESRGHLDDREGGYHAPLRRAVAYHLHVVALAGVEEGGHWGPAGTYIE